jgi:hypothetical protein
LHPFVRGCDKNTPIRLTRLVPEDDRIKFQFDNALIRDADAENVIGKVGDRFRTMPN